MRRTSVNGMGPRAELRVNVINMAILKSLLNENETVLIFYSELPKEFMKNLITYRASL